MLTYTVSPLTVYEVAASIIIVLFMVGLIIRAERSSK